MKRTETEESIRDTIFTALLQDQARRKLAEIRRLGKLDDETLAQRAGLDVEIIRGIDNGSVPVTPEIFRLLADACRYFDFAEPSGSVLH